jgi:hypothetical protein
MGAGKSNDVGGRESPELLHGWPDFAASGRVFSACVDTRTAKHSGMALNILRVNLELDRVHVHDEGDGLGSAEPYAWSVFFKIDGDTVSVTNSYTLAGQPTVQPTPGSHGNLGNTDADDGDTIVIPSAVGEWDTLMTPIPGPPGLHDLDLEFGGVVGVIVVLMEQDNVTDAGAEAGHAALNGAVRAALQRIVDTRSISNQDITEEEILQFTSSIGSAVEAAIVNQQNLFENLWSWLNPDDTIGSKVFMFTHDELNEGTTKTFSHRWKNEGDWEIFGHVTATVACPAEASLAVLHGLAEAKASAGKPGDRSARAGAMRRSPSMAKQPTVMAKSAQAYLPKLANVDISAMRRFRDGEYRNYPGLGKWFALAAKHAPRVAYQVLQQPELADSLRAMLEWGNTIADRPDSKITEQQIGHADRLLVALEASRSPDARMDARRARSMLDQLRGKTQREALEILDQVEPARHPKIMGKRMGRSPLGEALKREK